MPPISNPPSSSPIGHSSNLVGVPTEVLASVAFNQSPQPLAIAGTKALNPSLFEMLGQSDGAEDAALAFETYMSAVFGLDPEQRRTSDTGPRRFRSSYFRLLRGWGYDSNGPEGAVLKGWVESRFGLFPTFHKEKLEQYPSHAWMKYVEEKMSSRFHNNSILSQLDLLFTFCQWSFGQPWNGAGQTDRIRVYRGLNDFDEHYIREKLNKREYILRFNSLNSFTGNRDTASCFGDYILDVEVPIAKILFYHTLLPRHGLKGETEYMVIGGDYLVTASTL